MVKLGTPIDSIEPHEALLGILRATAAHVAWVHAEICALDDLSTPEAAVLLRLYSEERDRLTRIGVACVQAGIGEAQVRVLEAQISVLGQALSRAADRAGFSEDQRGVPFVNSTHASLASPPARYWPPNSTNTSVVPSQ